MDYKEKAAVLDSGRCVSCDCGVCVGNTEAALREAAADAYKDAAEYVKPWAKDDAEYFNDMAATLRSAKPTGDDNGR